MTGENTTSSKVPRLRFQEFQNEWKDIPFGSLIERAGSPVKVDPIKSYQEIGIRSHGKGIFHKELITGKDLGNKRVFWIEENTLILNIVFAWEQAIAITSKAETGMIGSHRFPMYRPLTEKANLMYLLKYFLTKNGKKILELASPGGAGRNKTLGQKLFENSILTVPHVLEQEKIALFLVEIDKKIEKLKTKKSLLEKYRKGVMQKIFSRKIRFRDENGEAFGEWDEKQINSICKKKSSNLSANSLDSKNTGIYKIYGASGIWGTANFYQEETSYVSIIKDGAGVGRISLCDGYTSTLGTLDKIIPNNGIVLEFFFYLLQGININSFITGSTIPHIYFKDYSKQKVQIPQEKEQQKIASFLSEIDKKINVINSEIENTEKWKKGLLQGMFI